MYINPGVLAGIVSIFPHGTNSTMFTECCEVAICDDQRCCPQCKRDIIGYDSSSDHKRGMIRWRDATKKWVRK